MFFNGSGVQIRNAPWKKYSKRVFLAVRRGGEDVRKRGVGRSIGGCQIYVVFVYELSMVNDS